MITRYTIIALLAMVGLLWSGCSQQTINSANNDVSRDVGAAGREFHKLDAKAQPQLDKLDLGARVTAALQSNANLPHTIRVDAGVNGVRLRGVVKNAHQKALAAEVAKQTLPPGKTVLNELTVKA